jgi:NADH:ubiquinone reductase (non-electrogenic)
MQPIRHILRYKKAVVQFFEADCTKIDAERKVLKITGTSPIELPLTRGIDSSDDIKGDVSETEIPFDYLVIGVGAQNSTFGIKGVQEHACFLKEIWDSTKIRTRIMVCYPPLGLSFCSFPIWETDL